MLPFYKDKFGNPSGSHSIARQAKVALEQAREVVAFHLGAEPSEVVFTASGTEADNMAVFGANGMRENRGGVMLCTAFEHHAVLRPAQAVGAVMIPVNTDGIVDMDALAELLSKDVSFVSVMLVNNEVGTVQPLDEVSKLVRCLAPTALLHTDAVQAIPWLDVSKETASVDMLSVSAHKFGGPKGVGALVIKNDVKIKPMLLGGSQEHGLRSGTHNVASIVGMAAAMDVTAKQRQATVARIQVLRDKLVDTIIERVDGVNETVPRKFKVAGNCHLYFEGVENEELLWLLDQAFICASAGSSCASGAMEPSHVLTAMGIDIAQANSSIRISLGYTTTDEDIALAIEGICDAVSKLRAGK